MTSEIVVTLYAEGNIQDFELPANVPLCELYPRLLRALQKTNNRFYSYKEIVLEVDGAGLLDESATLFDYGVCTGYYLDVVRKEKYHGFRQG